MRNKKYSSTKNFVNRRALQFVPFMMIYDTSALSKTGLERERDFHTGKLYFFNISENQGDLKYS